MKFSHLSFLDAWQIKTWKVVCPTMVKITLYVVSQCWCSRMHCKLFMCVFSHTLTSVSTCNALCMSKIDNSDIYGKVPKLRFYQVIEVRRHAVYVNCEQCDHNRM